MKPNDALASALRIARGQLDRTPTRVELVSMYDALTDAVGHIRTAASQCGDCNGAGVMDYDDPARELKSGDACPDCAHLWEFIESTLAPSDTGAGS